MYALVMWIGDEPTTSVVPWSDVEVKGKRTRAKWGPKYFPVQVLRQSPDKAWLQSLSVIANGQVIWGRPIEEYSGSPPKKKQLNVDKNTNGVKRAPRMSESMDEKPKLANTIDRDEDDGNAEENSSDEESEKKYNDDEAVKKESDDETMKNGSDDETVKNQSDEETPKNDGDEHNKNHSDDETAEADSDEKSDSEEKSDSDESGSIALGSSDFNDSDFEDSDNTRRGKIRKVKSPSQVGPFRSCIGECALDPALTPESVNFFKQLAVHLEEMLLVKQRNSGRIAPPGKSELIPGSGVWVSNVDIFEIKSTCAKKPKEMARRLMRSILSKEKLMNMTPKGRGSRQAIPEHIFTAVKTFVNENTMPDLKLTHTEYSRCLTLMCSTLRNAKPSTSPSPKSRCASSNDQLRSKLRTASDRHENERSRSRESRTKRVKLAPRKRPTISSAGSRKYKRIIQRKY